jgi:hypothetical protein
VLALPGPFVAAAPGVAGLLAGGGAEGCVTGGTGAALSSARCGVLQACTSSAPAMAASAPA